MICGVGPTKINPPRAGLGERGFLGQKAVTGMDRIDLRGLRDAHDVGDIEVSVDRRAPGADQIALVRLHPVQREAVLLRVDRDRADAELGRGAHHANGDLAAVGDLADCGMRSGMPEHSKRRFLITVRAHRPFAMGRSMAGCPVTPGLTTSSGGGSGALPPRKAPVLSCSYSLSMITTTVAGRVPSAS
jgi:hypothetical protein